MPSLFENRCSNSNHRPSPQVKMLRHTYRSRFCLLIFSGHLQYLAGIMWVPKPPKSVGLLALGACVPVPVPSSRPSRQMGC